MAGALWQAPSIARPCSSVSSFTRKSVKGKPTKRIRCGGVNVTISSFKIRSSAQGMTYVANQSERQHSAGDLWKWLVETGVVPGSGSGAGAAVKPAPVEEGLGLVAQRDIKKGEDLVKVPRKNWISVQTVKDSEIGRLVESQRPWVRLALFLIKERANSSSEWRYYIDSLPSTLDSTLFWSDEELLELQGTQLLGSTLSFREYVESEFNRVQEEVFVSNPSVFDMKTFTYDAFLWAFGILRSRTFPPLTGDNLALVPLADLVNHGTVSIAGEPCWDLRRGSGLFGSQDHLVVRATSNFRAGDQILMEYGANKGNGQLALEYGFVDKQAGSRSVLQSTLRDAFSLTLEIPESDRLYDDKLDVAELNGLGASVSFDVIPGEGPPEQMLAYLRLMALEGADSFLLEALFRNTLWEHVSLPVSRENEEGVCSSILEGCRSALAAYKTTVDEDIRLLEEGVESPRLETATVIRLGEKRVLEELQAWFEAHLARVDSLEYYAERRLKDLGLVDDKGFQTPWVFGGE